MRNSPHRPTVFFIVSAVFLVACGESSSGPSGSGQPGESSTASPGESSTTATSQESLNYAEPGGTINVRIGGDFNTFDPHAIPNAHAVSGILGIYDRVVEVDVDNNVIPYLAESWEATPSKLTFKIREDVTCSDGHRLTASDVAATFQRLVDAETAATLLWGPGPYTITSDDAANTFTMELGTPWSDALVGFTAGNAAVMCPAAMDDPDNNPVGSGAYTLESATHGSGFVLKKRSDWQWGPAGLTADSPGMADEIDFRIIENEATAANELLAGQIHQAEISGPDVQRLLGDEKLTHRVHSGPYAYSLVYNEEPGHATADKEVRRALSTAIDREEYLQAAFAGLSTPTPSFFSPSAKCFDPSVAEYTPEPSITDAQEILEDAGYVRGDDGKFATKDGEPLTVKLNASSALVGNGGEYLASRWTEVGFHVDFNDIDYATLAQNFREGTFDIGTINLANFSPASGASIAYLAGARPGDGGVNVARSIDPNIEELIAEAQALPPDESCAGWAKVQHQMLSEFHLFPTGTIDKQFFGNGVVIDPETFGTGRVNPITLRRLAP